MPHDYIPKQKAFYKDGRKVSRTAVRNEISKLLDHVGNESARLAKQLRAGSINVAEFELQMRELLKSAHIIAASVGKGGRSRMLLSDWGRVGSKIRWQYGYLSRFARKLKSGAVSEAATASRARSYASSIYVSFSRTFQKSQREFIEGGKNPERCRLVTNSEEGCVECAADEAEGWMSVDDMGEIGSRICGDFCKCDIVFEDDVEQNFDIKLSVEV
jgi:hypothetical protein